jgi:DNA topoisomerase-1
VIEALNEALAPHIFPDKGDGTDPRVCPSCGAGRLSLKLGRYGSFIGCSNYPECRYTRHIGENAEGEGGEGGDRELGKDPVTGDSVWLKNGRFGPYVQLGEGEKPKRSSLPKGWTPQTIDLEKALRLLRLPREVGKHPEDGEPILAGIGRYGPYVQHGSTYANLPEAEEVFDVGLNRAVTLLAEKRAGGGRPQRGAAQALKDLGAHPQSGEPVRVLSGRFGPYVSSGGVNANVPRGSDPQAVTMEQAVALLADRAAKGPSKGRRGSPRKTASKAPAAKKKAPAKKPRAKS